MVTKSKYECKCFERPSKHKRNHSSAELRERKRDREREKERERKKEREKMRKNEVKRERERVRKCQYFWSQFFFLSFLLLFN